MANCLAHHEFNVATEGPKKQLSLKGSATVRLQSGDRVRVDLYSAEKPAKSEAGDLNAEFHAAGTGGGAVRKGSTVVGYAKPVDSATLKKVEACAF